MPLDENRVLPDPLPGDLKQSEKTERRPKDYGEILFSEEWKYLEAIRKD